MSTLRAGKRKRKQLMEPTPKTWQERKETADKEHEVLEKEIQDLRKWTDMIDAMNDDQLKEYLKNRPDDLKTSTIQKGQTRESVQRVRKSGSSASTGIMASVWKFHKHDGEECSKRSDG